MPRTRHASRPVTARVSSVRAWSVRRSDPQHRVFVEHATGGTGQPYTQRDTSTARGEASLRAIHSPHQVGHSPIQPIGRPPPTPVLPRLQPAWPELASGGSRVRRAPLSSRGRPRAIMRDRSAIVACARHAPLSHPYRVVASELVVGSIPSGAQSSTALRRYCRPSRCGSGVRSRARRWVQARPLTPPGHQLRGACRFAGFGCALGVRSAQAGWCKRGPSPLRDTSRRRFVVCASRPARGWFPRSPAISRHSVVLG